MATEDTTETTESPKTPLIDPLRSNPAPPGWVPKKPPHPVVQGLSKALMQSAFEQFGNAFTMTGNPQHDRQTAESRLAPWRSAGAGAAGALQMRWHQMEYENFQQRTLEPALPTLRSLQEEYTTRLAQADEGVFEGPDGNPVQLDMTNKEDRLKSVRLRAQIDKKFHSVLGDIVLDIQNEAGKYSNNPLITNHALGIQNAVSEAFANATNPEMTMAYEEKMSQIRAREEEAEIGKMNARANAALAKEAKAPTTYPAALKDPNVGPGGIMMWLTTDPNGIATMTTQGGIGKALYDEEREKFKAQLMKDHGFKETDFLEGGAGESRLAAGQTQYLAKAAARLLESTDPQAFEIAKIATPHFFEAAADAPTPAVVSDERMDPDVRKQNVDVWKEKAKEEFARYLRDPNNDPSIEAALDHIDSWLRAEVYDSRDPGLAGVTAARGGGTRKYVQEVLTEVPKFIGTWALSKEGSALAAELNPELAKTLQGKRGSRGRRAAMSHQRRLLEERGERNIRNMRLLDEE